MFYSARDPLTRRQEESTWLSLPRYLVLFVGVDLAVFIVLAALKLDFYPSWRWSVVMLPISAAVALLFAVFTLSCFGWIVLAARMVNGHIQVDMDREPRLDVLFRTAKICFLGQGYTGLLVISTGLLLCKLTNWPNLPVIYPLLPIMVLGTAYIILAVLLRQPEVDAPWFFVAGATMLSQSIMLIVKIDHMWSSRSLPWAVVFIPSWLTYTLVLVFSILSPLRLWPEFISDHEAAPAGENPTVPVTDDGDRSGGAEPPSSSAAESREMCGITGPTFRMQLCKAVGLACWAIGWFTSQVLLAIHLDGHSLHIPWAALMLPAFIGWVLFVVFVSGMISDYFLGIVCLVIDTFGLGSRKYMCDQDEEQAPLLANQQQLPWR